MKVMILKMVNKMPPRFLNVISEIPATYLFLSLLVTALVYFFPLPELQVMNTEQRMQVAFLIGCGVNVQIIEAWLQSNNYNSVDNRAFPSVVYFWCILLIGLYGIVVDSDHIVGIASLALFVSLFIRGVK